MKDNDSMITRIQVFVFHVISFTELKVKSFELLTYNF